VIVKKYPVCSIFTASVGICSKMTLNSVVDNVRGDNGRGDNGRGDNGTFYFRR
jgi:hypothetical protein